LRRIPPASPKSRRHAPFGSGFLMGIDRLLTRPSTEPRRSSHGRKPNRSILRSDLSRNELIDEDTVKASVDLGFRSRAIQPGNQNPGRRLFLSQNAIPILTGFGEGTHLNSTLIQKKRATPSFNPSVSLLGAP